MTANKNDDIKKLMDGVHRELATPSRHAEGDAARPRVYGLDLIYPSARSIGMNLDLVKRKWRIAFDFDTGSAGKGTGRLASLVKRFSLKLTGWFMKPLTEEISEYNRLVAGTLEDLARKIEEVDERLEKLEQARNKS